VNTRALTLSLNLRTEKSPHLHRTNAKVKLKQNTERISQHDITHLHQTPTRRKLHSQVRRNCSQRVVKPWSVESANIDQRKTHGDVSRHSHSPAQTRTFCSHLYILYTVCEPSNNYHNLGHVKTRNSSADDIVHSLQNTRDSYVNSVTDRCGNVLEHRFTKFSEIAICNGHYAVQDHSR